MNIKFKNFINWVFPVCLILFILEIILLPFVVGMTYAGRSEVPDHTLTYEKGKLVWNDVKGIDQNGVAELSIFDAKYQNVSSDNGKSVIAPGTQAANIIRLKNSMDGKIGFTAVLYSIKSDESLPVKVSLADGDFTNAQNSVIPNGTAQSQIIRSVCGEVRKGEIVDFDISWLWDYEVSNEQDLIDVDFGNKSANGSADDIKVGFYLVVEDNNEYHIPQIPETGDNINLAFYAVLLSISGAVLILTAFFRKRENTKI